MPHARMLLAVGSYQCHVFVLQPVSCCPDDLGLAGSAHKQQLIEDAMSDQPQRRREFDVGEVEHSLRQPRHNVSFSPLPRLGRGIPRSPMTSVSAFSRSPENAARSASTSTIGPLCLISAIAVSSVAGV